MTAAVLLPALLSGLDTVGLLPVKIGSTTAPRWETGLKDADVDSKVEIELVDSNPLFEAKNSTIQNTASNQQQVSRRTAIHRVAKAPSKKVPPAASMTQQAFLRKKSDESAQSAMKQRYTLSV